MNRPRLLLTRPVEEAARTVALAEAAGFVAVVAPLQTICPVEWGVPAVRPDALLFTSARAPAFCRGRFLDVPAYAVGPHTAAAAKAAGYGVGGEGEADGSAALALAVAGGARVVLHPGGAERAPIMVPPDVRLHQVTIYDAPAVAALPPAAAAMLGDGAVFATLLFSPRAAGIFARLSDAAGLDRRQLRLIAMSPAVAAAAGSGWRRLAVASRPGLEAVFAAAHGLWQGEPHG